MATEKEKINKKQDKKINKLYYNLRDERFFHLFNLFQIWMGDGFKKIIKNDYTIIFEEYFIKLFDVFKSQLNEKIVKLYLTIFFGGYEIIFDPKERLNWLFSFFENVNLKKEIERNRNKWEKINDGLKNKILQNDLDFLEKNNQDITFYDHLEENFNQLLHFLFIY